MFKSIMPIMKVHSHNRILPKFIRDVIYALLFSAYDAATIKFS